MKSKTNQPLEMKSKTNQPLGMKYQDKYGLAGTRPSDFIIGKDGNVKLDTAGHPVRRINSYFTTDVKKT